MFVNYSFWVTNVKTLNPHFGSANDLKALSKAVHDRGMQVHAVFPRRHIADLLRTPFTGS